MNQTKVVVKKVKQYPFGVQFKTATGAFNGQIVKLTPQGFLAEVPVPTLQPLERLECAFELPVLHKSVASGVVVVKVYNQWNGGAQGAQAKATTTAPPTGPGPAASTSPVVHLVELHFQSLPDASKNHITSFLKSSEKRGS